MLGKMTSVELGKNSYIRHNKLGLVGRGAIHVGDNSVIGSDVIVHLDVGPPSVWIGHGVHVGNHAILFGGVHIGDGAVILPYSVVSTDIPAGAVVSGNPAVVIRMR